MRNWFHFPPWSPTALARVAAGALALAAWQLPGAVRAQAVMFGAVSHLTSPHGFDINQDYPDLFEEPVRWPGALSRIDTFIVTRHYVSSAPPEFLRRQFAFLRRHGVGVGLALGVVQAHGCGHGIEGMVFGPNVNEALARRLRDLGADLRYALADEPYSFGHVSRQPGACRYSVEEVARSYAREMRGIRRVFPEIRFVDTEASSRMMDLADVARWARALLAEFGPDDLPVMNLDVQWQKVGWRQWARPFIEMLQRNGMRYGVIYHGVGKYQTDASWSMHARGFAQHWEELVSARPAFVVIQSWNANPSHLLPETDANTLTGLVNGYCADLTRFRLTCNRLH